MKIIYSRILLLLLILSSLSTMAQEKTVRGTVTDSYGPLLGATIYFQNKDSRAFSGQITNAHGEYLIRVPQGMEVTQIVYSFIGYKTKIIKYTGQTQLNVVLEEDVQLLDEAVVSTQRVNRDVMGLDTKSLGAARQKVNVEDLQDMSVTSVEDMLKGKMANVDIVSGSGAPGVKASIRIRGTSSLNASNEPLIVIDNIPQDMVADETFDFSSATMEDFGSLLNIAPSDIESIEVLKDGAATAVWGVKASNGVLMVKTLRGKKSKPTFSITQKVSTSIEPARMPMLNGREYVTLMQDALWNYVRDGEYKDESLLKKYKELQYDPAYTYFREFNQETDWLEHIKQTPVNSETSFSMQGGGDKATYRFSASYLTERGTTIGEDFKRVNARLNLDYVFSKKVKISAAFSYAEGNRNLIYDNARGLALKKMPNMSPFVLDKDGNMTDEYFRAPADCIQGKMRHPIALAYDSRNNMLSRNVGMNYSLRYTPLPQLVVQGDVSFSLGTSGTKQFLPASATAASWSKPDEYNYGVETSSNNNKIYVNLNVNYTKRLGDHTITGAATFQGSDASNGSYSARTGNNPSIDLSDPSANGRILGFGTSTSQNRDVAFLGTLFYSYKNKYNINGFLRSDASSVTGRNSRWGTFPNVNFQWNLGEENFIGNWDSWLSELRLRASWGRSGRSPQGSSTYAGTFEAIENGYVDMGAIKPNSMQLDKLKWEKNMQWNYGFNFGALNNDIYVEAEYYIKTTSDLLQQGMKIQSSTGYETVPWFNDGKIRNQGWEVLVRVNNIVKYAGFRLSGDFNISRNRNVVLELPMSMEYTSPKIANGVYANKVVQDRPVGSFYGFRYLGVYQNYDETIARDKFGNVIKNSEGENVTTKIAGTHQQRPGDARYYDVNYDGVIDKYDIMYLGNSMPLMIGGGSLSLEYQGIRLRSSVAFRIGQSVINMARLNAETMSNADNQSTSVLRRWRNEGDDTDIPRALWGTSYNSLGSDRYVERASFMKVKDITLSYQIPKKFVEKLGLRKLYVYLTSYNPFMVTNYKGQDPEVGTPSSFSSLVMDNSLSPSPRRFAFGLTLDF